MHFKFGAHTGIDHRDRLTPNRCVQGHVTYLIFGEITDNILETAQDRDVVTMKD